MKQYSVSIKIDKNSDGSYEKERRLTLDFAAIVEIDSRLQRKYNKDFMQTLQEIAAEHFNFDCLVDILWLGLNKEDPKLSRPKLIGLINDCIAEQHYDMADIITFIVQAAEKSGVLKVREEREESEEEESDPLASKSG